MIKHLKSLARRVAKSRLAGNKSGVALIEFAYTLPVMVVLGTGGIEVANLSVVNLRISQIAMTTADNVSRAKQAVPLQLPELRDFDINDVFAGAAKQAGELQLFQNGRVIISGLQQNALGGQEIRWQRCKGLKSVVSKYGNQGKGKNLSSFQGMGSATNLVQTEAGTEINFVEVEYNYTPLIYDKLAGSRTIRKEAAFYVRDDRNLTGPTNPAPQVVVASCSVYSAT
jgi:hypothetical protein